jgi:four helix bundle protein
MRENIVVNKSFKFAVSIIRIYQFLANEKKEYVLSKQILRSGTSVGANIEEAVGGISDKDFTAKMSIAYKEAREIKYWLKLLYKTEYLIDKQFNTLIGDCEELLKKLYSIIKTSKNK